MWKLLFSRAIYRFGGDVIKEEPVRKI